MGGYFDNAASAKICPPAAGAMCTAMEEYFANPSASHALGLSAAGSLYASRKAVADSLCVGPDSVYFTSGGTESNNLAIIGAARAAKRRGTRIVTSPLEHPSVLNTAQKLADEGFEIVLLPVKNGGISEDDIYEAVTPDTILVSLMQINNETGAFFPLNAVKSAIKRAAAPAVFHCDMTAGFLKHPISMTGGEAPDLVTVSSHKIHGPKGIGCLIKREGVRILPVFQGGGQEKTLRSGTVPVELAAGMAAAVLSSSPRESLSHVSAIRARFLDTLKKGGANFEVNSPENASPYILNISFLGYNAEPMLNFLSERGYYLSAGSACAAGRRSKVLTEMGLDIRLISSALRVSFCAGNTEKETDGLAKTIMEAFNAVIKS